MAGGEGEWSREYSTVEVSSLWHCTSGVLYHILMDKIEQEACNSGVNFFCLPLAGTTQLMVLGFSHAKHESA